MKKQIKLSLQTQSIVKAMFFCLMSFCTLVGNCSEVLTISSTNWRANHQSQASEAYPNELDSPAYNTHKASLVRKRSEGEYASESFLIDNDINTVKKKVRLQVVPATGSATIHGELKTWHKVTLDFVGPETSETASTNPFTNYRLDVTFMHQASGKTYVVPGYYAADGDAANTSATSGKIWRVHFAPCESGTWNYAVSFRTGSEVAAQENRLAGKSAGFFDGDSGSFTVASSDKTGRDLRSKGRLEYVGKRYLQFAGNGEYFLKQGADAPENLLAYEDFDNTTNVGDRRKAYAAHAGDWKPENPSWQEGKGTELIGAINYLASEDLNAFSFIPMNLEGDDKNVFPYLSKEATDRTRIDVSKLAQWEIVFEHATAQGFFLHFKTQETENETLLDGGDLGLERKLYYRELIARFSHHLALNWNLGEENKNKPQQVKDFAQYFYDNDPYRNHVVLHTYPQDKELIYTPLLGQASQLTGLSLQTNQQDFRKVHEETARWVNESAAMGKPWAVAVDEPGDAQHALRPDSDKGNSHEDGRKNALWGTLMAGGYGNEWYFGYAYDHSDLTLQDFRSRDEWWDYTRYALDFFQDNAIPFWEMHNDNEVSSAANDYGFCKSGEVYVVYLKQGGTTAIDLTEAVGVYEVKWFDPRNGGELQEGSVSVITGGDSRNVGEAPNNTNQDWVVLVRKQRIDERAPVGSAPQRIENDSLPLIPGEGHDRKNFTELATFDQNKTGSCSTRDFLVLTSINVENAQHEALTAEMIGNNLDLNCVEFTTKTPMRTLPSVKIEEVTRVVLQSDTSEEVYQERGGLIVMEMENSSSNRGLWIEETTYDDFTGDSYLQFNGNTPTNGPPNSPLEFKFSVSKPGLYYLHLRAARDTTHGQPDDYSNDAYVRVEGDYGAGPNPGNTHGDDAPLIMLQSDTKFFGGNADTFAWASGNHLDPGGQNNKRVAVYDFKAGEEYRLVISGRSQYFSVDRIIFRHESVGVAAAQNLSNPESTRTDSNEVAKQ